jgi:glycosyltransferase involved in cell wall biosynthesis
MRGANARGFAEGRGMSDFGNVALAHHWLVGMRGGEKVLEQIAQLFPGAPICTLVAEPERLSPALRRHEIRTSWLQRLPGAARHYKKLLPLFPAAVGALRVREPVDLVISSDASVIKGLAVPEHARHICYCHSPPRYLWDLQEDYRQSSEVGGAVGRFVFNRVTPYVREFDRRAAARVTHFIANSSFVRGRLRDYYGVDAEIIHPPVALDAFTKASAPPEDFDLVVSQLVPYKRIDVAVAAYTKLVRKLVVIGEGSERARLEALAGPSVTFLGAQPGGVLQDHFRRGRALIFPGVEDFGITPLEAMASGRPVIAYRAGGVLETVVDGATGLFFDEQTPESLADALARFDAMSFDPAVCRAQAERFGPERFRAEFGAYLERHVR